MYKLTINPDLVIDMEGDKAVSRGSKLWPKYERWLADGNTPLPAETEEEVKVRKKAETENLAGEKADLLLLEKNRTSRRKLKQVARGVKLVLKKIKGNINAGEEAELDAMEALDNQIDAIYGAADSICDHIDIDSGYDHISSGEWP